MRVVTNRMIGYMRDVGLISKQQHGFVAGRSCTTLLSTVCHHWAQLLDVRSPPVVNVIFLDWSKAFDKGSHSIPLSIIMVFVARCGIGFLHFSISVINVFSLEGLLPTGCLFYLEFLRALF